MSSFKLLSLGLEFQHKLSSLFSEKLISWNYERLSRINFHLRTLIFIFALNSHLQLVFDSSNGSLWTLSADTEFPWEEQYRIKTEQPFPENITVQRKAWNKWPFKCVARDAKVMFATRLQKNNSSCISFSKKPEI